MKDLPLKPKFSAIILIFLLGSVQGFSQQINFESSKLQNISFHIPTSLQFGPDGRLYVAQQDGTIKVLTVKRVSSKNYSVTNAESIDMVKKIPNYNDDGSPHSFVKRQLTGLAVAGTASKPIIYAASSDYRIGAGTSGDEGFCTNSGVLSRLTWDGSKWVKIDLVRGFPRSEENHAPNGLVYDKFNKKIYLTIGGFTNAGAPSKAFTYSCEYALSAAILSIDLPAIESMPVKANGDHPYIYDMPTLDDPDRVNKPDGSDPGDPFGGNDGLNQAKIVPGGPVQIYASGFRNAYDLVLTKSPGRENRLYVTDNGANPGWGGHPANEGAHGNVTNNYPSGEPGSSGEGPNDPMVNNLDAVHYIGNVGSYEPGSYYGGHPCPIRANPNGAGWFTHSGDINGGTKVWRTSKTDSKNPLPADWPPFPISMANPIEGDYQNPGVSDKSIITFTQSTNGICEYSASSFNGAMQGDLLAIGFEGAIFRIRLNDAGNQTLNVLGDSKLNQDQTFATGFGSKPLDVIAQGDNEIFPGTIWAAVYGASSIVVFEPLDNTSCTGTYSLSMDEDEDKYSNADEIDNGTNPCSAASQPNDNDQDFISDLKDTDDDNDGIADVNDAFAVDGENGLKTNIPIDWALFNNDPGTGLFGLGFTGLMVNGSTDYLQQYDLNNMVAGGAAGAFTLVDVPEGDAFGTKNTQQNAFQWGINVNKFTKPFVIDIELSGPFFNNLSPQDFQSAGAYIGNGDQDNYLKIVLNANGGVGGIQVLHENLGSATSHQYSISKIPESSFNVIFEVDPAKGTVQPIYKSDGASEIILGSPVILSQKLLQALQSSSQALAVGLISTSEGAGGSYTNTWDHVKIYYKGTEPTEEKWEYLTSSDGSTPIHLHEHAFVEVKGKFYALGGRGKKAVQIFDPVSATWTTGASPPVEVHHFQGIVYDDKIWAVGAFSGGYPEEVPVENIYVYDPTANAWQTGPEIPVSRRRGSSGTVLHNNKIYLVSGLTNGHTSGHVTWFDEYNPSTGQWKQLPDIPHARDHFHAVVLDNKLWVAAGRKSSYPNTFGITVPEVDVYDFTTGKWQTLAQPIPTARAGVTAVALGNEVVVLGGESMASMDAHNDVEALNKDNLTWRALPSMLTGRQGMQAFVYQGKIHVFGGNATRGGSANLNTLERYTPASFPPSDTTGTTDPIDSVSTAVYLVNCGGASIAENNKNWLIDTQEQPSSFSNSQQSYSKTKIESFSGTNKTGAPNDIYASYRWDGGVNGDDLNKEMRWSFPVDNGEYKVTLYFIETYFNAQAAGYRVFDVAAEGNLVLDAFDIYSEFGYNIAGEKVINVQVEDGVLNIDFLHQKENPKVSGISIFTKGTSPVPDPVDEGVLSSFPISIDFGMVAVGSEQMQGLTLKNTGGANLSISSVSTTGSADFTSSFTLPVSLTPGDSVTGTVSFSPSGAEPVDGVLNLNHSGSNNPLSISISGSGFNDATDHLVVITSPAENATYLEPADINITAEAASKDGSTVTAEAFSYLEVSCPDGGWRKLKLGFDSDQLYNPKQNVTAGGNNKVELVMKDISGNVNWTNIQIRLEGSSANSVGLASYWSIGTDAGDGWKRMVIPLSVFGAGNFTELSHIEIPYSAGAGIFKVGLKELAFTGGSVPFLWFGKGKTDNKHDGFGGDGQLIAQLKTFDGGNSSGPVTVNSVSFYSNGTEIASDPAFPYSYSWVNVPQGSYSLTATAFYSDGSTESSIPVAVNVSESDTTNPDPNPATDGKILFRINAGGYTEISQDTSGFDWVGDPYHNPSPYVNSQETGNKVWSTSDDIKLHSSVPDGVPVNIFKSERSIGSWAVDTLGWKFPVNKGGEVEVRLYFAEIYFTEPGQRVFDVQIEDSLKLKDYDIVQDVGPDTGTVKTFRAISDGQLDINFIRITQNPKISGIEIICLNDICNNSNLHFSGGFSEAPKNEVSVYPNPTRDNLNLTLDFNEVELKLFLFDSKGNLLQKSDLGVRSGISDVALDMSELEEGIYFLKISSEDGFSQTLKVVKE